MEKTKEELQLMLDDLNGLISMEADMKDDICLYIPHLKLNKNLLKKLEDIINPYKVGYFDGSCEVYKGELPPERVLEKAKKLAFDLSLSKI